MCTLTSLHDIFFFKLPIICILPSLKGTACWIVYQIVKRPGPLESSPHFLSVTVTCCQLLLETVWGRLPVWPLFVTVILQGGIFMCGCKFCYFKYILAICHNVCSRETSGLWEMCMTVLFRFKYNFVHWSCWSS